MCDTYWRHVADLQDLVLYKAVVFPRREHRVSPMTGSHLRAHRSAYR